MSMFVGIGASCIEDISLMGYLSVSNKGKSK
jgi:hypothetical protein